MKKVLFLVALLMISCQAAQQTGKAEPQPKAPDYNPLPYEAVITQTELTEKLYTYASDDFEGRDTGSPGQKKAVNYLKEQYEAMGIPAAKSDGDYFQKVPLQRNSLPDASVQIDDQTYTIGEDFAAFNGPREITLDMENIVFAGYGIESDTYSDYEGLDVEGKIVLIKAGEPVREDGMYVISGTDSPTPTWSNISQAVGSKRKVAESKKAAALLFYDESNTQMIMRQYQMVKGRSNGRMSLSQNSENSFFMLFVNGRIATALYPEINQSSKAQNLSVPTRISLKGTSDPIDSENVIAWIKGSEKPDEYLVISAHLDHEGIKNDQIYNGADDDGSGTVAVLQIAKAFKKAADDGNGPRRSVVFLHVTAEEKGLLGSEYYAEDPVFPLEQTVANLNIDMIGRIDPKRTGDRNYIYLIGSDRLSTELHQLSEDVNTRFTQITLDYKYNDVNDPNRFYYRSDHYHFAKNNIPIIFYFNGTHADYHKPTDTPDKIEYDLLTNRTKLIFHTAWEIVNREDRIVVDQTSSAE